VIVGLSGYAQSGKDTVAQVLVDNYGFNRVSFADPIRKLLYETNPMLKEGYRIQGLIDVYGWDKVKVEYPEARRLLQDLGVGARKVFGDDIWIYQVLKDVHPSDKVVISDVRFINEAECISARGGELWRIKRPGVTAVNAHVSETQIDDYPVDHVVNNEGDVKDLWEEVLMLCHHMGLDDDKFI